MFSSSGGVSQVLVTETFTASQTWTAPVTTSRIEAASGKGAAGLPAEDPTPVQKTDRGYTFYYRAPNTGVYRTSTTVDGWPYGSSAYCDPLVYTPDDTNFQAYEVCYYPRTDYVGGHDAVTGESTTAFGKTFPGGTGGAASTTNISNIAITPGGAYSLVIPTGGSLTISYYK